MNVHDLHSARILVVDDDVSQTRLVEDVLRLDGYSNICIINDPRGALSTFIEYQPDIVLLDLMMPYVDGFTILEFINPLGENQIYIPILVVSGESRFEARRRALAGGAVDYLTKPFEADELRLRVANMLRIRAAQIDLLAQNETLENEVRSRTQQLEGSQLELKEAQIEIVARLARAAERRDDETGLHTQRVAIICALMAQTLGIDQHHIELLQAASPLHDVGKIGIPDSVLLKPGAYSRAERAIMQTHCNIGGELLAGGQSDIVKIAERIALTHHEKWDGSGYPHGRRGEEISIEARILAVADVFDALTHRRPYKEAWPLREAIDEIWSQRGRHFDPQVVDAFLSLPHEDLL